DTAGVAHDIGATGHGPRPPVADFTYYPSGAAQAPGRGSWVACAQGLVRFDALGQPTGQRLGGLADPRGLAISPDGSLLTLTENRQRFIRCNADDTPDATFASNANEPWRVANGWSGYAIGLAWMGDAYLVLDRATKALWRFDPDHVAWGEKPWIRLTAEGVLLDPRVLAVGEARAFVLDGERLLSFAQQDVTAAPVEVPLPQSLDRRFTALATQDDHRFYAATALGVVAFSGDRVLWTREDLSADDLAVTDGALVVAVGKKNAVVVVDPASGKTTAEFTDAATPAKIAPGCSVAVSWPWVYATDVANSRLLRLRLR
ncbi:MAG: hypothetical protein WCP21_13285, partial [Armatimonadota bacterium]